MRRMPATDVGVLRRHRGHAGESRRAENRIQAVDAVSASVLLLHRMKRLALVLLFCVGQALLPAHGAQTRVSAPQKTAVDIVITGGTVITMAGPNIPKG